MSIKENLESLVEREEIEKSIEAIENYLASLKENREKLIERAKQLECRKKSDLAKNLLYKIEDEISDITKKITDNQKTIEERKRDLQKFDN